MRHQRDHLAQIQARSAAKGHHAVMPARQIDGDAVGHILLVRIRVHLRKHRTAKACGVQHIQRLGGDGQSGQRLVCYQQRLFQARSFDMVAQLGNAAHAEFDRGGVVPVPVRHVMGHGVTLSSDGKISGGSQSETQGTTATRRDRCLCTRSSTRPGQDNRRGS